MSVARSAVPGRAVRAASRGSLGAASGLALVVVALQCGAPALGQAPATYLEYWQRASDARESGDWEALGEAAAGALEVRPGYPFMLVQLAVALARSDRAGDALEVLDRLARMGVAFRIQDDPELELLHGEPGLASVEARLEANARPVGSAAVAARLEDRDFFAEGIARHPATGDLYLGSVRHGAIVRVDATGVRHDLVPPGPSRWGVYGLAVDLPRGLLWAATASPWPFRGHEFGTPARAAVVAYSLDDGAPRARLEAPQDGRDHVVGEVVVAGDGTLYAADSLTGAIYRAQPGPTMPPPEGGASAAGPGSEGGDALPAAATASLETWIPSGLLLSPQGMALDGGGTALYVADYNRGIYRIVRDSGAAEVIAAPSAAMLYGIDGLGRHGNALVAVQNRFPPHRVVRLELDDEGTRIRTLRVLLAADPRLGEPTQGVVDGDRFFLVANSPWGWFPDPSAPPDAADLPEPLVLRIDLEPGR